MLLSTSGSAILYHFTSVDKAVKIIKDGFVLTPTSITQSDSEISEPATHFLSLTRMSDGRYHRHDIQGVLFKFDGNKLATRYKVRPVDYWQMYQTPRIRFDSDEAEERIFSNSPKLDLMKYVTEVRVLLPRDGLTISQIRSFISLRRNNRSVVFYNTHESFVRGSKKDVVSIRDLPKKAPTRMWQGRPIGNNDLISAMLTVMNMYAKNPNMNLYNAIEDMPIGSRYKGYIRSYHRDLTVTLRSEFQQAGRSQATAPKQRKRLDSLIAIMRRFGLNTPDDLSKFLINKYHEGRPKSSDVSGW